MSGLRRVRLTPLYRKFSLSLIKRLSVLLLLTLVILVPIELTLYRQTANREYKKVQQRVAERLKAIASTAILTIDGEKHLEVFGKGDESLSEFQDLRESLRAVHRQNSLTDEIYTLRLEDEEKRLAKFVVMSGPKPYIGDGYIVPVEMMKTFKEGQVVVTDFYTSKSIEGGRWMSVFAPIKEPDSEYYAVLEVDISVENLLLIYENDIINLRNLALGRYLALVLVFLALNTLLFVTVRKNVLEEIDRPLETIVDFVHSVKDGNLLEKLQITSGDEMELLGDALNEMVEGLKQKQAMSKFLTDMELAEVNDVLEQGGEVIAGGAKRDCTVLFSDIRNFTSISESCDPSVIIRSLNMYFDVMIPIIEKYGGSLDKLIGDAIMAVFEYREGYDHASSALLAAIEMQSSLPGLRDQMTKAGLPEFHAGFGINSGEAVVGNVGTKNQLSRTVLGDAVNLSARVESLSKDGKDSKILFTEFTLAALKTEIEYDFLLEATVKGKSKPVKIYEVSFSKLYDWDSQLS